MAESIRDFLFGGPALRGLVETIVPQRTFSDVILPPETQGAIEHAVQVIRKHDLLFRQWGLGDRHSSGLGLAFHFAGPPGTGKTICAEAIAKTLGRKLLLVRYSGVESRWAGQTAKHLATIFRAAEDQDAVLFFDEADAIAGRRFTTATMGYEREANAVVNVLLQELERFDGVLIFATNLAAGMDPAFERRIRTHILFRVPGPDERERIWQVQIHPDKTPLAPDVDFRSLAEQFPRSGGDIKNAVLKAAELAALEPVPDAEKQIHHRHFEQGIREVIGAAAVMSQSLFETAGTSPEEGNALDRITKTEDRLQGELALLAERLESLETTLESTLGAAQSREESSRAALVRTTQRLTWLAAAGLAASLLALSAALFF